MISRIACRATTIGEGRRWQRRSWRLAGFFAVTVSLATTGAKRGLMTATDALSSSPNKIAVIGGGASGMFASIAAAEHAEFVQMTNGRQQQQQQKAPTKVVVLEATSKTLSKVKISGGGRCNVLHDTSKSTPTILSGYPRGQKELNGLYHKRFTPTMARDWFELRGVELKVEEDGRMFPVTDSSQTIIDTLMDAARAAGVDVRLKQKVTSVDVIDASSADEKDSSTIFTVHYKDGSQEEFSSIILATGSTPAGHILAKSLGHDPLVPPVPSLFTLNCKHAVSSEDGLLHGLSGLSVPTGRITLRVDDSPASGNGKDGNANGKKKKRKKSRQIIQEGPILITHHGISGPATLRLSAFAAREFKDIDYRGQVTINWDINAASMDKGNAEQVLEELWKVTFTNPKRNVASLCPLPNNSIPRRLWNAIVLHSGFTADCKWGSAPKKSVRRLAQNLVACPLEITSKGTFKEEFVTAGGVDLKEINMKTMESKVCPGLFLCGEVINVDGVTGGFNFMNCWSTGFVAGESSSCRTSSLL